MKPKYMAEKVACGILSVLVLIYIVLFLGWRCYLAGRKEVYESLYSVYGEQITLDEFGAFWITPYTNWDYDPLIYPFQERVTETEIQNGLGITAEVTKVSVEENVLMFRYYNASNENITIPYGCQGVEKWIRGNWYNVTYFHVQNAIGKQLDTQQETTLELTLFDAADSDKSTGLTRPEPGRYRLILPVAGPEHFYITAEFEIP